MKKNEFVRLIEKKTKGQADVFYGILVKETKEAFEVVAVDIDVYEVHEYTLLKSEHSLEIVDKQLVKYEFERALCRYEHKKVNAEFDLEDAKTNFLQARFLADMVFNK